MNENERVRRELIAAINAEIDHLGWTQVQTAEYLGVAQPRVSELRNGKFRSFRVDSLVPMAKKLGITVEVVGGETEEGLEAARMESEDV